MAVADQGVSLPALIIVKFVLNCLLVWLLDAQFSQFFDMTGGVGAYVIVGSLLTLMNLLVRPLLSLILLPLKLFASILAIIIINGLFVWLIATIVSNMQADYVTLAINGGLTGWFVVAFILGFGNWLMKASIK